MAGISPLRTSAWSAVRLALAGAGRRSRNALDGSSAWADLSRRRGNPREGSNFSFSASSRKRPLTM
jgi:hypothetical protein